MTLLKVSSNGERMIELHIPPYACDILKTQLRRNQLALICQKGIYFLGSEDKETKRIGALRYEELGCPLFVNSEMFFKNGTFLRIDFKAGGEPFLVSYTDSKYIEGTINNGHYWELYCHDFEGVTALYPFTQKCERELQHLLAIAGVYDAPRAL